MFGACNSLHDCARIRSLKSLMNVLQGAALSCANSSKDLAHKVDARQKQKQSTGMAGLCMCVCMCARSAHKFAAHFQMTKNSCAVSWTKIQAPSSTNFGQPCFTDVKESVYDCSRMQFRAPTCTNIAWQRCTVHFCTHKHAHTMHTHMNAHIHARTTLELPQGPCHEHGV